MCSCVHTCFMITALARKKDWKRSRSGSESSLNVFRAGFIVGVFSLGCVVSSLPPLSAYCLDTWGRRSSIIIGSGVFLLGSCLQVMANSIPMMLWGRFVSGLSIGLLSTVVSLYQSELAPSTMRGCLTSIYQLMITAGILLAAIIDHYLVHRDDGWRWAISIQMVPALVLLFSMPFMPRSPRWLVQQDRCDEALEALRLVRDDAEAEAELAEIKLSYAEAKAGTSCLYSMFICDCNSCLAFRLLASRNGANCCMAARGSCCSLVSHCRFSSKWLE